MLRIDIEDADLAQLEWALDCAEKVSNLWKNGMLGTDAEQELGRIRVRAIERITRSLLNAVELRSDEIHSTPPGMEQPSVVRSARSGGSTYMAQLPAAFPWVAKVPKYKIRHYTAMLLNLPSSFAVTADASAGHVWLWLSDVSLKTIKQLEVAKEPESPVDVPADGQWHHTLSGEMAKKVAKDPNLE